MRVEDLGIYSIEEFTTYYKPSLFEHWREYADKEKKKKQRQKTDKEAPKAIKQKWVVKESGAFKKAMKKYKNDKVIVGGLRELLTFTKNHIDEHGRKPLVTEYPPKFYVHPMTIWGRTVGRPNALSAHIKGQKIMAIFDVDTADNTIYLLHLGTQQALGFRG